MLVPRILLATEDSEDVLGVALSPEGTLMAGDPPAAVWDQHHRPPGDGRSHLWLPHRLVLTTPFDNSVVLRTIC